MAVDDPQVLPLDEFDAHLVGQEGVFEIGGIVAAGRQHGDASAVPRTVSGRTAASDCRSSCGIVLDRPHLDPLEQLGEQLHHRLAVLQHVGDARRRARIVFQHVELVLADAHDVDADDVGVDAARRPDADHLGQERVVGGDQLARHAAGAQDLLAVIDVVEEGVERLHALLDALRQPAPFGAGDDARHDVERDQPLGRFLLAIDGEGDAGLAEHALGIAHLLGQPRRILRLQPAIVSR